VRRALELFGLLACAWLFACGSAGSGSGKDASSTTDADATVISDASPSDAIPMRDASTSSPDATSGADAGAPMDATSATDASWWHPVLDMVWDWQLVTPVVPAAGIQVYEIDMFDNTSTVIASLHGMGAKILCYVDMGSWESYRPDANQFPQSVLGAQYAGFPDERWLDIRQIALLTPIVHARFDLALSKGCDGIEADNVDGYDTTAHESTGFPLTYQDQLTYNRFLASEAHARGMAIALKNDINQIVDLEPDFDCEVSEQCFQYMECTMMMPFLHAGKAVFEAEYQLDPSTYCPMAVQLHISAIRKHPNLDSYRVGCP
jgi:hypothetical protein